MCRFMSSYAGEIAKLILEKNPLTPCRDNLSIIYSTLKKMVSNILPLLMYECIHCSSVDKKWMPTLCVLRIDHAALDVRWSPDGSKFAVGSGAK